MEQQTPITPQIKDDAAQKPKRAISHPWFGGGGGGGRGGGRYKFLIYFVQDCNRFWATDGNRRKAVFLFDLSKLVE